MTFDLIAHLREAKAREEETLKAWETRDFRLRTQSAGEPLRDVTDEAKADMRRIIADYDRLIEKYSGAT